MQLHVQPTVAPTAVANPLLLLESVAASTIAVAVIIYGVGLRIDILN